jgi:hypothetical protein
MREALNVTVKAIDGSDIEDSVPLIKLTKTIGAWYDSTTLWQCDEILNEFITTHLDDKPRKPEFLTPKLFNTYKATMMAQEQSRKRAVSPVTGTPPPSTPCQPAEPRGLETLQNTPSKAPGQKQAAKSAAGKIDLIEAPDTSKGLGEDLMEEHEKLNGPNSRGFRSTAKRGTTRTPFIPRQK